MSISSPARRDNPKNSPENYSTVANKQLPGIESFFEKDVPFAFAKIKDAALLAEFKKSNQGSPRRAPILRDFPEADLLPRSQGDFRIGVDNHRQKLLYDEMVDTPIRDRLLAIG
jgi:hypothetical protein